MHSCLHSIHRPPELRIVSSEVALGGGCVIGVDRPPGIADRNRKLVLSHRSLGDRVLVATELIKSALSGIHPLPRLSVGLSTHQA
jgi:hypothetical protein